jgi:hypothetical protein
MYVTKEDLSLCVSPILNVCGRGLQHVWGKRRGVNWVVQQNMTERKHLDDLRHRQCDNIKVDIHEIG